MNVCQSWKTFKEASTSNRELKCFSQKEKKIVSFAFKLVIAVKTILEKANVKFFPYQKLPQVHFDNLWWKVNFGIVISCSDCESDCWQVFQFNLLFENIPNEEINLNSFTQISRLNETYSNLNSDA